MSRRRFILTLLPLLPAVSCSLLASGCGDSQSSGTQVQFSPEAKTQINDMREMYRSEKPHNKKTKKR